MVRSVFLLFIMFTSTTSVIGQCIIQADDSKKYFIGSSLFMLANLSDDPPNFYQLNLGYRITPISSVSIEAITWEYSGPLGRPYGDDFDNEDSNFPGIVKANGIGLAYKRFLWKDFYTSIHATVFHQKYIDTEGKEIQSGFQLFNTLRFGYQFKFFKAKLFIEPSIALTSWPINTNLPESFQVEEDKWNNYFLFEPGLNIGINF